MGINFCLDCFEKQRRIDQLEEEVRRLKQQWHYRERRAEQGPFGSSTPSARRPFQAHSSEDGVEDRRVAADNHRAERELRPTIITRKTSFGSQSDAGAKTREILTTLVHTLAFRFPDPETHFKSVLDQLAEDPTRDPIRLMFPFNSS